MLAFLAKVQPRFLTSIHQPFGEVGKDKDKPIHFQRRLARDLRLPLRRIDIGGPTVISTSPACSPAARTTGPRSPAGTTRTTRERRSPWSTHATRDSGT